MADLIIGSSNIISTDSGTPTIQSGVDLGITANHSGVKTALNASGNMPIYACRAWVNFDGSKVLLSNLDCSSCIVAITQYSQW